MAVVEYTLERLFASKKYGGQVPQALLHKIRSAAFVLNDPKPKGGTTKGARQKAVEDKEAEKLLDTDLVLEVCHFQCAPHPLKPTSALTLNPPPTSSPEFLAGLRLGGVELNTSDRLKC